MVVFEWRSCVTECLTLHAQMMLQHLCIDSCIEYSTKYHRFYVGDYLCGEIRTYCISHSVSADKQLASYIILNYSHSIKKAHREQVPQINTLTNIDRQNKLKPCRRQNDHHR